MSNETLMGSDGNELDMAQVEIGLAVFRKAFHQAVDELGGAVPGVQLRALLIFEDAGGSLDMRQLAAELTASVLMHCRIQLCRIRLRSSEGFRQVAVPWSSSYCAMPGELDCRARAGIKVWVR